VLHVYFPVPQELVNSLEVAIDETIKNKKDTLYFIINVSGSVSKLFIDTLKRELVEKSAGINTGGIEISIKINAPVLIDVAPVVIDVAPVVIDVAPVVIDVAPVVIDVAPVVIDVAPVLIDDVTVGLSDVAAVEPIVALTDDTTVGPAVALTPEQYIEQLGKLFDDCYEINMGQSGRWFSIRKCTHKANGTCCVLYAVCHIPHCYQDTLQLTFYDGRPDSVCDYKTMLHKKQIGFEYQAYCIDSFGLSEIVNIINDEIARVWTTIHTV
jgi:hypothetical protein